MLEAPVGTLLITIFDHLMFAVMRGAVGCLWVVGNSEVIAFANRSLAKMSCWSVLVCPPVRTMFPFAVHLAEEMWMCGWSERLRDLFKLLHRACGGGRLVGSLDAGEVMAHASLLRR